VIARRAAFLSSRFRIPSVPGIAMHTRLLDSRRAEDVRLAAGLLRCGQVVAFPTETVYGLGARADDERAIDALCDLKARPREKKLTILIPDPDACRRHAAPLSAEAGALAAAFWPGPLTLVVPDGRGGCVGLRCPDLPVTRRMLRLAGAPVAAPSANLSGQAPATTAEGVMRVFGGRISAVLDGGPAGLKVASTVVRVDADGVEVLREGALSEGQIREAVTAWS
jgi:L-threonylcarbamoyladenylate synthase